MQTHFIIIPQKTQHIKTDIGISLVAKESVIFIEGEGMTVANFEDGHIEIRGNIKSLAF